MFDTSNDVVSALKNEQVDAIVVDVPTAFFLTAVQVPEATTVGQFEAPGGDEWGALLEKDSPLTDCVVGGDHRALRLGRACRDRAGMDRGQDRRARHRVAAWPATGPARMSDRRAEREAAQATSRPPRSRDRGDLDRRRPRRDHRADRHQPRLAAGPRLVLQPGGLRRHVPGHPRRVLAGRPGIPDRRGRRPDPRSGRGAASAWPARLRCSRCGCLRPSHATSSEASPRSSSST